MKSMVKRAISLLVMAALVFFFAYYIYIHGVDFRAILNAKPIYIFFIALIFLLSMLASGIITKYVLVPFNVHLDFREWFGLTATTCFYNLITPFHAGMLSKAVYLRSRHRFSYSNFITVISGIHMIQFWAVSLVGMFSLIIVYLIYNAFSLIIFLILFFVFIVLGFVIFSNFWIPYSRYKLVNSLIDIVNGWTMIKRKKNALAFAMAMALVQILLGIVNMKLAYGAIGFNVTITQAIFLGSVTMLSNMVSITPGNLGFTEAVSVLSALVLGITLTHSLSAAILNRVIQTIILFVLGPAFSYFFLKKYVEIPKISRLVSRKD